MFQHARQMQLMRGDADIMSLAGTVNLLVVMTVCTVPIASCDCRDSTDQSGSGCIAVGGLPRVAETNSAGRADRKPAAEHHLLAGIFLPACLPACLPADVIVAYTSMN